MPATLHVDEAGREQEERDFVVGGALVSQRRDLAARLRRVPHAWPFLDRPLHGAHLRCAGHIASRWWAWAQKREDHDPRPDIGLFGEPADDAREMWQRGWYDEHLQFQTWAARSAVDVGSPALVPAAFFRRVLAAPAPPPDTTDIGALRRWARQADLRGPVAWRFLQRLHSTVLDALLGGGDALSVVLVGDEPMGATLSSRRRYLDMLDEVLRGGLTLGAVRARVQGRTILPPTRPASTRREPLTREHIVGLGVDIPTEVIRFWRDARPGDEAIDLLLGEVRLAGPRAITPVPVHRRRVRADGGGAA